MSENPSDLKQPKIQPEELKQAVTPDEKSPDTRENREYSFAIHWEDGHGKLWSRTFVNKVPDIGTRQAIGVLRAKLAGNVPVESLDPMTQEINLMIAHLTYSLEKRPEWAENLAEIMDVRLLQAIYSEVLAHEATFLGYGAFTETGTGES